MAYPYYQPLNYQPNIYQNTPYYQQTQQQNSGFVSVRSMDDVQNWAIAAGNSITFYVETVPPVIATKTKGFSQLEMPVIKVFDLIERKPVQNVSKSEESYNEGKVTEYALKSDLESIWSVIDDIKGKIDVKKSKKLTEDKDE